MLASITLNIVANVCFISSKTMHVRYYTNNRNLELIIVRINYSEIRLHSRIKTGESINYIFLFYYKLYIIFYNI